MALYAIVIAATIFMEGIKFETLGADGSSIAYEIKNMLKAENMR